MNEGRITISRTTSNMTDEDWISINISSKVDEIILNVKMTLEEFAMCITGNGRSKCQMELFTNDLQNGIKSYKNKEKIQKII